MSNDESELMWNTMSCFDIIFWAFFFYSRWAMFGIAVGLLTGYATGTDFVDQLKIIVSNLGIADLE